MKWIAVLTLFFACSGGALADERLVTGVVLSCMKDGIRHYASKPINGCSDYKAINYQYVERILRPGEVAIYRCQVPGREPTYRNRAGVGCSYVSSYFESLAAPPRPLISRGSYTCTSDCSGHRAGYEWARNRGIADAYQCSGNSQSFIEGCRAFTEGHPGF